MRPTVLVVDDDDDIRELTRVALELVADWGVLTAAGGAEALELAARHRPDAVLLDLMMPGMDGLTTFRHLRADPATGDIPVILVTAKARVGERQAWDELEIAGVISKPFDPIALAAYVSALLGWPAPG
jgi:CheY-like chemotaxis protein